MKFFDIKLAKFALVGILNTIVGCVINFAALNVFGFNFWVSGLLNYIPTSVLSFFMNKYFTFKSKGDIKREALKFALNIAICWVLAYGIAKPVTAYFMNRMGEAIFDLVSRVTFGIMNEKTLITDNTATCVGMVLFVIFNYTGQRFFAFKAEE